MHLRVMLLITFALITSNSNVAAQIVIKGIVLDSLHQPVPFVNIGIRKKNIGTASLNDGTFNIRIPEQHRSDTLTFSCVGYHEFNLPVSVATSTDITITLRRKVAAIPNVQITATKLAERRVGITRYSKLFNIYSESNNPNDILEVAQLIKLGAQPVKLTAVNLFINYARVDSGTFRINLYDFNGTEPTGRLVEQSIVQTKGVRDGWVRFDVGSYDIRLKGDVVVSVEFIPTLRQKNNGAIMYGVKFGGSSQSFVRTSSLGLWSTPPHRYPIHVTVLDEPANALTTDDDDEESIPAFTLPSHTVGDTFSIFVRLPRGYDAARSATYPTVYLLDANLFFDDVAKAAGRTNVVLVGVGYRDIGVMDSLRNRDYTFPEAPPADGFAVSGGAQRFHAFLTRELIPRIDSLYRTDKTTRTLMGHSLGGFFTLYAFAEAVKTRRHSFSNYVAASPSLHYADSWLVKEIEKLTHPINVSNRQTIMITAGEQETELRALLERIEPALKRGKVRLTSRVYPKAGHMDTALPTFRSGLRDGRK